MRKGFSVTLAMVAFAMLAYNASAYAPTIDDLPDIVIGDAENTSGANVFVYPDAINLDAVGHDDATTVTQLIWSFSESGTTQPYVINKATPSVPGTDNLVSPAAAKRIDNQYDPMDPTTVTLGARTITFRDALRSPLTGAGSPKGPYADNLNGGGATGSGSPTFLDSRVITMYCSDGSTVSLTNAKSFIVYTLDNGYDRLSPRFNKVYEKDFKADHTGWTPYVTSGSVPNSSNSTQGICLTVGSAGDNDGQWQSTYGDVDLVANSCWEARLTVSTTNATAFNTPLWLMVYDNAGGAPGTYQDEYGGEFFFLDNEGGANSPLAVGRSNFTVYMMPIAQQTPQFSSSTNGFYTTILDPRNDMRLILRVFDMGTSYGAQYDAGAICWSKIEVYQHDLADMVVDQDNVMNVASFTGGWSLNVVAQGANLAFTGGAAVITPTTDWNTGTIILFAPGDQTWALNPGAADGGLSQNADNFPITWLADSTYYIEFQLSAINSTAEATPPDVIRVGADTALTAELTYDNFYVPNTPDLSAPTGSSARGVGMPRVGTPQKYACFFTTHSVTKSGVPNANRWRPRFEILTSVSLTPQGRPTNPTGLNVNSMKVQKVHFSK
ncbi:hypothetical protein LLG95_06450 [bacterium]|nr:hypothetical protein [bacterium]